MRDFELAKALQDRADEILYFDNYSDEKQRQLAFENLCNHALSLNKANIAYLFSRDVGNFLDDKYRKAFDVAKFEDVVIKGGDEELIYMFGRDIEGANLKKIISKLSSSLAKKELGDEHSF